MSKIISTFDSRLIESLNYQTPYLIFSKKKIINNYKEFKKSFPDSSIHYAMKANSEPKVLQILSEAGCGFEVASKYELDMLKKIKVPAERIVYGTSVKPSDSIK